MSARLEVRKDSWLEDDYRRLDEMASRFEPRLKRRFTEVVRQVKDQVSLEVIESLLNQGQIEQALLIAETAALGLAGSLSSTWNALFIQAGTETAAFLSQVLVAVVNFDQVNAGAVSAMQANRLDLVREVVQEQRLATQQAILDGVRRGLNPRQVALEVRESIGLTQRQVAAVSNYRRLLEQGSADALSRGLRDARFDPTVRRAAEEPLTSAQVDRMTQRYQERYLDYRARVVARTEALRAANQGSHQLYIQAIDDGQLSEQDLERKWVAGSDARTRDSHRAMQGQTRGLREPFHSGNGNLLMYPGDPSAPADDTIQCRCAVATRFRKPST